MVHVFGPANAPGISALQLPDVVMELGQRFVDAGHELSLVGGPVRDLFLGRVSPDLDFTSDADPDAIIAVIRKWADSFWEIGRDFGTIGLRKGDYTIEVTTYRADAYDPGSRKPRVAFGKSLEDDLFRRDFTMNAMALRLPSLELVDPYGGVRDLHAGMVRTPRRRSRTILCACSAPHASPPSSRSRWPPRWPRR
jgi:poly(A) polymerase